MFRSSILKPSVFVSRTNNKTLFTKNVNQSANCSGAMFDPELMSIYSEVVELSKLYAVGNFTALKTRLTNEKYTTLSIALGKLRCSSANAEYEMIRVFSLATLQGLQRAFVQNTELENIKKSYIIVRDRANILDDMDRLREFLADLNSKSSSSVFGEYSVTSSVSAVISPLYLLYIEAYGFPQDAVFDSEKLASISIRSTIL